MIARPVEALLGRAVFVFLASRKPPVVTGRVVTGRKGSGGGQLGYSNQNGLNNRGFVSPWIACMSINNRRATARQIRHPATASGANVLKIPDAEHQALLYNRRSMSELTISNISFESSVKPLNTANNGRVAELTKSAIALRVASTGTATLVTTTG